MSDEYSQGICSDGAAILKDGQPMAPEEIIMGLRLLTTCQAELTRVQDEVERLKKALEFYANPDNYFALMIIGDSPCGDFINDLDQDYMEFTEMPYDHYERPMPGKTARQALTGTQEG